MPSPIASSSICAADEHVDPLLRPGCFDNRVVQGDHLRLVVKDCGVNNWVQGNITLVDTNSDPCY